MGKSKVAQAKEKMLWQKYGPMCGNCRFYTSEKTEKNTNWGTTWIDERKKRCLRGKFATGKSYWCPEHEFTK